MPSLRASQLEDGKPRPRFDASGDLNPAPPLRDHSLQGERLGHCLVAGGLVAADPKVVAMAR